MPDHQYSTGLFIRHPPGDMTFVNRASRSLDKIFATGAGLLLRTAIQINQNVNNNRVVIKPGAVSLCRGGGMGARTLLAQAILDGAAPVGPEINVCLTAAGHAGNHAWLAAAINNAPLYTLVGPVSAGPSNLGVTAADVNNWINNGTWPAVAAGAVAPDALARVVLTALWPGARTRPGNGSPSLVEWNVNSGSITTTTNVHMVRSKSLGLAHELVHASYDGAGLQMGIDNGHATTALYEYMCVGLGIWNAEPYSENAIRGQWHGVVKTTVLGRNVHYAATAARPAY